MKLRIAVIVILLVTLSGCGTYHKLVGHIPFVGNKADPVVDYEPLVTEPTPTPTSRVEVMVVVLPTPKPTPAPTPWTMFPVATPLPTTPVVWPTPVPVVSPSPTPTPSPTPSPSPVKVTSAEWRPYERILERAKGIAGLNFPKYVPSAAKTCNTLLNKLTIKAIALNYTIENWPPLPLAKLIDPNATADDVVYGVVASSANKIILSTSLSNCGQAETLAHELGHIALYNYTMRDSLNEVAADLIQYGIIQRLDIRHDTADLTARFLAGKTGDLDKVGSYEVAAFQKAVLESVAALSK